LTINNKFRISRKALNFIAAFLVIIYAVTFIRHQTKELPEQLNYESQTYTLHDEEIQFLSDITINTAAGAVLEHEIFNAFHDAILNAEKFIVLDMFMFTDLGASEGGFPTISRDLSLVILNQMEQFPDLNVWIITDHINTSYGSHPAPGIEVLEERGAEVVYAELDPLRDPVPIYSSFYRMFFQWFGYGGSGWITNHFGPEEPGVSLRSYLKMLNTKGNHRKVLITENEGIYTSANAHDPSGFHSNIGVRVTGSILEALLEAERRVVSYCRGNDDNFPTPDQLTIEEQNGDGLLRAKVITEGKIFHEALNIINEANAGEALWLGMYLLSDPDIIEALENAAERGISVRMILDPNQKSFGSEKPGIPNIAVTHRIAPRDKENLDIRWYKINEEQYHSKILFLDGSESKVLLGSINYTKRSFHENNLENNLLVKASEDAVFIEDVRDYFHRLWNNTDHEYTLDYEDYQDTLSWLRRVVFRIQKTLRITTF
jgi:HKD family nuclease